MEKGSPLRLIILEESQNDAESLANVLRNAGHALRMTYVDSMDSLETTLEDQTPDVLLCGSSHISASEDVVLTLAQRNLDAPVIALAENVDEPAIVEALRTGVAALVSYDLPEHLQLVAEREISALKGRRTIERHNDYLRESEKRYRTLMDSSRDAIIYAHEGMHVYANPAYLDMFGFENSNEIEGTSVLDMVDPSDHGKLKEFLRNYAGNREQGDKLEVKGLGPGGHQFNTIMEFAPASIDGEPCTQIIIRNQADSAALEDQIKTLSKQDILTGLYSRQHFMEVLESAIDADAGPADSCAAIYLLLDNFKSIRENIGIAASDLVLSDIASVLRSNTTDTELLARFGDHSFSIMSTNASKEAITELVDKIRISIEEHISEVDGRAITTTCSLGVSILNDARISAQDMISRADLACEVARSAGGNQAHIHNTDVDEQLDMENEERWEEMVRKAIAEDHFQCAYQPIVSLQGEEGERYEVLLRITDEQGEYILPGQLISIAEKFGICEKIDRWVIEQTIRTLAERRDADNQITFFIKISGPTLSDNDLLLWISDLIKENRISSDSIVLEISEEAATGNLKDAKAFIKAASALHCKTAIEHFGCGTSQPQLLKHLPVDYLKIDGSIIRNIATDEERQMRVREIIKLARSLDKQCIAECVDDASCLAVLWQTGVDFIQGHFVQEPDDSMSYDFHAEIA